MNKVYRCAWCFQINQIFVDVSAGEHQTYTEDCQVCCRPNVIRITIDPETLHIVVECEAEG